MDHGGWYISINKLDTSVLALKSWWDNAERSKSWQDAVFDILCFLHAAVAATALIQLIRIQRRVPEYGWTTQKVFYLLNFIVNAVRALVFLLRREVQTIDPPVFRYMLLDLPGLLFFSTYTLLVLFWAEIYFQARSLPTDGLHPSYLIVNAVIYITQFCIWIYYWWTPSVFVRILSNVFFAGVSFFAALGFLLYGGRLFLMLRRFPVESKGRQKKLNEVGFVTAVGVTCFLIRCLMVMLSAFIKKADFDNIYHPIVTGIYQLAVEILPSALVLFILRKLPPKRESGHYHPIS